MNLIHRTKKKHRLFELAGLYAFLAAAVVFPVLFYLNNDYFADTKAQSTVNGNVSADAASDTADSGGITEKIYRLSGIPAEATDISFSYNNSYCTYLCKGIVYVRAIDTNKTIYTIKDSKEIKKAVLMGDRNILICLTADVKNGLQTSGSVGVATYNIEKNAMIAQKSFTVGQGAKIKQIDYSSLTNLIFVNIESGAKDNITDQIYYLNINKKVRTFSTEKIVDNMVLLSETFDLYYQNEEGILFCNSKKVNGFENEKVSLLGRDSNDNIYVQSLVKKGRVYIINGLEIVRVTQLDDTGLLRLQCSRNGIYAVYDGYIKSLADNADKKILYDHKHRFLDMVNDRIYLKDKNNDIVSSKVK